MINYSGVSSIRLSRGRPLYPTLRFTSLRLCGVTKIPCLRHVVKAETAVARVSATFAAVFFLPHSKIMRIFARIKTPQMNIEQVRDYTLSLYGVTEDQPFGDDILTFRLEGKIFVCLWLGGGKRDMKGSSEPRLALKLSPERNIELREQFAAVTPAWHWNKKHWSDVYYEQLDNALVQEWIKESYLLVASKLPKVIRQEYLQ